MDLISLLIDDASKITSAICGMVMVYLAFQKILPKLEEIHTQTNSLALKAEAGAHAQGVQEGLKQAAAVNSPEAVQAAAALVLSFAAEQAASVLSRQAEPK